MSEASNDVVLVTGGAGFVGSYLVRELVADGREVCVFDVIEPSAESRFLLGDAIDGVRYERGSIDDWSAVLAVVGEVRPRWIVHTASIMNPLLLMRTPMPGFRVNLEGTVNVLEAIRLVGGVERLVNFSSIGVLPAIQYEPIDAAHPIFLADAGVPTGIYGASKIAGEAFCFAYHHAFGIDFRTIRPSAVYGFGMQWPMFVKPMVEGALRGEPVRFASGARFPRDYTHAEDVARLAVALLDAPDDADRIFYGATGRPLVTAAEAAAIVRELVPGADIEIEDRFTPEDELELPYRGQMSIEPNRVQLGWEPKHDLRSGLADFVDHQRRYMALQR